MGDAYRDDHAAALHRVEVLERENHTLRDELQQRTRESGSITPSLLAALLTSLLFLAGAVVYAGALSAHSRATSSRGGCPRLRSYEPGVLRVEVADGVPAQVLVDGAVVPRSGAVSVTGPLDGGRYHDVSVTAAGYRSHSALTFVHPGHTEVIRVALEPSGVMVDEE